MTYIGTRTDCNVGSLVVSLEYEMLCIYSFHLVQLNARMVEHDTRSTRTINFTKNDPKSLDTCTHFVYVIYCNVLADCISLHGKHTNNNVVMQFT